LYVVPRRKVWLTPAAPVPCSNAANIGERKTWTQSEFCTGQNSVRGKSLGKCIHSVPAQETAKHPAEFGWPLVSDVAAVTKAIRYPLKFVGGAANSRTDLSRYSGPEGRKKIATTAAKYNDLPITLGGYKEETTGLKYNGPPYSIGRS